MNLLLIIVGLCIEILGMAVLMVGQARAERLRRAKATQHRISSVIAASLAAGALILLGGLVTMVAGVGSASPTPQNDPWGFVIGAAIVPLVLIAIGLVFLTRRLRTLRRLNDLGREHPLCCRATVDLDASPEVVLGWVKLAARSAHAQDIEIDAESRSLWAEVPTTLIEAGRMVDVQVDPLATGGSHVAVYSWPTKMVKRDRGTGRYFVDRFADKLREISTDPPDPVALTSRDKWG